MRSQFHAGDVCTLSAGVADISRRRLLALCSDELKSRKFQYIQDLATIDVLRDIDCPSCAIYGASFAYMRMRFAYLNHIARRVFIFGVGFALSVLRYKAMRQPLRVELENCADMKQTIKHLYNKFRHLILYGIIGGLCATLDFGIYTLLCHFDVLPSFGRM